MLEKTLGLVFIGTIIVGGLIVAFLTVSTVVDATMRYVFSAPIYGIPEVNQLLLPTITFLSLAAVQKLRGHIRVDMLVIHLSARMQLILEIVVFMLGFVFMAVMGYQSLKDALYSFGINQVMWGVQRVPMWWAKFAIPVGCWLLCLQYIGDIANNIVRLRKE